MAYKLGVPLRHEDAALKISYGKSSLFHVCRLLHYSIVVAVDDVDNVVFDVVL